jgi:hypothetical protein
MPAISFDIPNDLLLAISNKAQADSVDFADTAIALMWSGLSVPDAQSLDPDEVQTLVDLMIERAKAYSKHTPFTTQDLLNEIEWHSFRAASRKSAGRGFSKAVKGHDVAGVRYTNRKTIQNKSIYTRE